MTANEEVNNEAKNGDKDAQERQESIDANEQKSNIEAEKVESLPINEQESNQDENEKKSEEKRECDENENDPVEKNENKKEKPAELVIRIVESEKVESLPINEQESNQDENEKKSEEKRECDENENDPVEKNEKKTEKPAELVIRIIGFTRLKDETEEFKLYHTFFTEEIGISAPLVEISARLDDSVIFSLKSEEDKTKLFLKFKKRKIYKWKNCSLELKGVPRMSGKEFGKLPLDEALQILYPYKEIPYAKQLKEKTEASKTVINAILPRKEANVNLKQMVPTTPVEGYDYHVPLTIEEEPDTKGTVYGIKVISADRKKTCIVPIELCPNVPHQIALVAKDFVDHMAEFSLTPFNQKTSEGNILGIALQMTQSGNFIMTIFVPTAKLGKFKQLTPNGVNEDVITIDNFSNSDETRESLIEKAEKYFNIRGKGNGLVSVYMTILNNPLCLVWNLDQALPEANHILGVSSILTFYNGQDIQMTWTKDYQINNSLIPILNTIQEWGYINSDSSICIACNHKIVPLYLVNKVENLILLSSSKKGHLISMRAWAKKMGLYRIDFVDMNKVNPSKFPFKKSNTAIIWHKIKKYTVDVLLAGGVTNIIFVSYWTKDPPDELIKQFKGTLESVLKDMELSNVFPIDIAPYTDRFCLLFFFHAKKYSLGRKRSYDNIQSLLPYYEADYYGTKRFKASYF